MTTVHFRVLAVLTTAAAAVWLPFAFGHADPSTLWLAVPFLAANALLTASLLVGLVNNWHRAVPEERIVAPGAEPEVGVIIPTAGESVEQLRATAASVLAQDWPADRLVIVISDDAWSDAVARLSSELAGEHPAARIDYHRPPRRGAPDREGEAKAGNLNSALRRLDALAPGVAFVETRDADDLVGDARFLRACVAQLLADRSAAFVQTVKEARTTDGDPFDNLQPHFFRGSMHARHAANAVFPCGSGLVWRRAALEDIGRFPTWNLVEDLQSGVEALRRGWRGIYLPIVGAVGQHAPEDLPNVVKQRGTWALDTVRLLVWGQLSGLGLRQRLQFAELGLFYLQSLATLVFIACPVIGFSTGRYPLETTYGSFALHFWPFAIAVELYLVALGSGHPYERLWRARVLWIGLAPVYAKACLLAVVGGPRRKPSYRVTRKHHEHRWYWRESLLQAVMLLVLAAATIRALASDSLLYDVDLGSIYWAVFFALTLGCFLPLSWHGMRGRPTAAAGQRPPAPVEARAEPSPVACLVMPVHDQAASIERAIRRTLGALREASPTARLVVVDDGSTDATCNIARRVADELDGVAVLHRSNRAGLGVACRAGFEHAVQGGAELIVHVDAGLAHDGMDWRRLIRAAPGADVVIGSGSPGAPRSYRREVLESVALNRTPRNAALFQMTLTARAEQAGFSVLELPDAGADRPVTDLTRAALGVAGGAPHPAPVRRR